MQQAAAVPAFGGGEQHLNHPCHHQPSHTVTIITFSPILTKQLNYCPSLITQIHSNASKTHIHINIFFMYLFVNYQYTYLFQSAICHLNTLPQTGPNQSTISQQYVTPMYHIAPNHSVLCMSSALLDAQASVTPGFLNTISLSFSWSFP